ncbi:Glycosyltransferase [Planctomycetales bacterium 10988]|nr:Glycosyltransferase [Planctomycetales bacterium 10988]
MRIHLYANCWNDIRMLPYFMRHYLPYVDQFVLFDDHSTDVSVAYLSQYPQVEVCPLMRNRPDSFIESMRELFHHCWKESRGKADWVIVCNVDEHHYHPDLLGYLEQANEDGITVIPSVGYQMVNEEFPEARTTQSRLCDMINTGVPYSYMDKIAIFNPNEVDEINYAEGRHSAQPTGNIVYPKQSEVLNLHFKYLSKEYVIERHAELCSGLRSKDFQQNWGIQYTWDRDKQIKEFDNFARQAVIVPYHSSAVSGFREAA